MYVCMYVCMDVCVFALLQLVDRKAAAFLPVADRLGVPVVINSASMLLDIDETWSCSVPAPYSGQYSAVMAHDAFVT